MQSRWHRRRCTNTRETEKNISEWNRHSRVIY